MRFAALALLAAAPTALAQSSPITAAVARLQQVQQAFGKGVQIYACQNGGGGPKWIAFGPDAILYRLPPDGPGRPEQVATHSIGPVWQWNDGSGVFGTTLLSVPSTEPNSVPTLMLQLQPFGSKGVLSGASTVVRSAAHGGTAPARGCDAAHVGTMARVPYTATYTFYTFPGSNK